MQTHTTPEISRPGREEDAHQIAAAAHAWLDRYNGRAVRLHRAHVFEICRILLRAGVQPTVEAIRQVNGGVGSPNVIHPELKAYFREKELLPGGTVAEGRPLSAGKPAFRMYVVEIKPRRVSQPSAACVRTPTSTECFRVPPTAAPMLGHRTELQSP